MVVDISRIVLRSVRFRVAAIAALIVATLLVAVAIALVVVQHRTLTAAIDDGLERRADDLAAVIAEDVPVALAGTDDETAAQLTTPSGIVVLASHNLAGSGPVAPPPPGQDDVIVAVSLAGLDDSFRVLSRRVVSPEGPLILHVAIASDDVSDSVAILRGSLLVAIPLAVGLLAIAVWWLVGQALRPVGEIRSKVESISESDLNRRVPVPESGDEIERLAVTMNDMLDRIESGVTRLQRFVADASHELRSPLTRMRSELEVDLANSGGVDLVATHRSVLEETVALQQLVDDLLYLARSDADRQVAKYEPVDIDDLVLAEVDRLRIGSRVRIDISEVSAGQVLGDRSQLKQMVRNLADNAAHHATTTVGFALDERSDAVVLAITDDGPGIAAGEQERVFERFARTDEGRSRDAGGSGLGLAIVRDVVARHGGVVGIDPSYTSGARFVVRLPGASRP